MTVSFHVAGVPVPKGSMTRMPNGAMLPAGGKQSRINAATWRQDVRAAAAEAMGEDELLAGAIRMMIDVTLPYPHSTIRKWQVGWWPAKKKPDIDKLARGVLDHLTGVVWCDDSQVICLAINKWYAWDDKPGADIVIDELPEETLRQMAGTQSVIRHLLRSGHHEEAATARNPYGH